MKKLTYLFAACMVSLVVASCGGGSNSSEADKIAQLEDSIRKIQSDKPKDQSVSTEKPKSEVSQTPKQDKQETTTTKKDDGWNGVSSRGDFPSILSGTEWMTDNGSRSPMKFEFNGDRLDYYKTAGVRENFDDPIEWEHLRTYTFTSATEPKEGEFHVNYRYSGDMMINLIFDGKRVYKVENTKQPGGYYRTNKVRLKQIK